MKRREFLSDVVKSQKVSENYAIAQLEGDLEEYQGEWGVSQASHLLRRTLFGYKKSDLEKALSHPNSSSCVDELTQVNDVEYDPPIRFFNSGLYPDDPVEVGHTWVNAGFNGPIENERIASLKAWAFGKMLKQDFNIREKMVLFWSNHFSTESEVVRIGVFHYNTNQLFRNNALGNFKYLVEKITLDPTMLFYLNGNENVVGKPNENFARELFELFTIGKGPIIGEGNYTNFTEKDIREAAKVLTGWNLRIRSGEFENELKFYSFLHDFTAKEFSSSFNNTTIVPSGENEYKELIDMIFQQDEVSRFIVRKLYRWFVYYHIDSNIEEKIIEPLAKLLRDNNFDVAPVVKKLLKSNHFFDATTRGVMVKCPLDFVLGIAKNLELNYPTEYNTQAPDYTNEYYAWLAFGYEISRNQQQELFDPPSVAGWEAYYQVPTYYRIWISSATLQLRKSFYESLLSNRGLVNRNQIGIKASGIAFAETLLNAEDPNELINELCQRFYPNDLTENQKSILKLNLVDEGQGDYNWSDLWKSYTLNKSDQVTRATVETKLSNLLKKAFDFAEYQLS